MTLDRLIDQHSEVIRKAIAEYYESPAVVGMAATFAQDQGQLLQNYSHRERIFILTDGEPYTAEYIINRIHKQPAE